MGELLGVFEMRVDVSRKQQSMRMGGTALTHPAPPQRLEDAPRLKVRTPEKIFGIMLDCSPSRVHWAHELFARVRSSSVSGCGRK